MREIEEKLRALRSQFEARASEIAKFEARKVLSEREQADTLLEGRANAFTVESETKLQNQLNQFKKILTDGE